MSDSMSQTAPARSKGGAAKLPRLAPLDHVRNLYADTTATLPAGRPRRIVQKKDLINALRSASPARNTKTMPALPSASHVPSINSGPVDADADPSSKALYELEATVNSNARKFNELKLAAERKQEQLRVLTDTLTELEVENAALERISAKQTTESIRIESLKDEINQVMTLMEDKEFQKRQLDHMSSRLRKNQINFDAHIKSMEEALNASKKELRDVESYLHQLELSKEEAAIEVRRFQAKLDAERRARDKELAEKQAEVESARKIEEWKRQRETVRAEMAAEMRGDLSADQEAKLLAALQDKEQQNEALKKASKERAERASTLEDAFLAIKQATGAATLDEMVEKFLNQGSSRAALEDEQAEAEARLAKVKAAKEEVEAAFTDMKASGLGGTELNREIYVKMEEEVSEAKAALKVSLASAERLEGVLVAVRQGAVGLAQRLAPFESLLAVEGGDDGDEDGDDGARLSQDLEGMDTLSLLLSCEKKLGVMLDVLGRGAQDAAVELQSAAPTAHKNNVRVYPRKGRRPGFTPRSIPSGSDSEDEEGDDAPLDRFALKKRARKKELDEIRRREAEARRKVMAQKIAVDLEKKATMERLTQGPPEPTGMSFLTQKPDLL